MNRRLLSALATAALWCAATVAGAHVIPFYATLNGVQVVPKTPSRAQASAFLGWDHHRYRYQFDLNVRGIRLEDLVPAGPNGTFVQVCWAPRGENGPVVLDVGWAGEYFATAEGFRLVVGSALFGGDQGEVSVDPILLADYIFEGTLYIIIHTSAYPDGEIRGQLAYHPRPQTRGPPHVVRSFMPGTGASEEDLGASLGPQPAVPWCDSTVAELRNPVSGPTGSLWLPFGISLYWSSNRGGPSPVRFSN